MRHEKYLSLPWSKRWVINKKTQQRWSVLFVLHSWSHFGTGTQTWQRGTTCKKNNWIIVAMVLFVTVLYKWNHVGLPDHQHWSIFYLEFLCSKRSWVIMPLTCRKRIMTLETIFSRVKWFTAICILKLQHHAKWAPGKTIVGQLFFLGYIFIWEWLSEDHCVFISCTQLLAIFIFRTGTWLFWNGTFHMKSAPGM